VRALGCAGQMQVADNSDRVKQYSDNDRIYDGHQGESRNGLLGGYNVRKWPYLGASRMKVPGRPVAPISMIMQVVGRISGARCDIY